MYQLLLLFLSNYYFCQNENNSRHINLKHHRYLVVTKEDYSARWTWQPSLVTSHQSRAKWYVNYFLMSIPAPLCETFSPRRECFCKKNTDINVKCLRCLSSLERTSLTTHSRLTGFDNEVPGHVIICDYSRSLNEKRLPMAKCCLSSVHRRRSAWGR